MAQLITTDEEKAAASFLDWDDAALGRMCKKMALTLKRHNDKKREAGLADDDIGAVINASDGMLLVGVNGTCVKLEDAAIVYETGTFTDKNWSDAQALPHAWYVQTGAIESFGLLK